MPTPAEKLLRAPRIFTIMFSATVGLEALIARFPLVLLSQTTHSSYSHASKELIRTYNPNVVLLGYQVFSEEVNRATPGPGEALMWALRNATPDPYMRDGPGGDDTGTITQVGGRNLYDYRKPVWQNGILAALEALVADYAWDGFFFDNCTVFAAHHPDAAVRAQLLLALRGFLRDVVRPRFPNLLLIGNSGDPAFEGLNGELNENRPNDYATELPSSPLHSQPEVKLAHRITADETVFATASAQADAYGSHVFQGAGPDYNLPYWFSTHTRLVQRTHGGRPRGARTRAGGFA